MLRARTIVESVRADVLMFGTMVSLVVALTEAPAEAAKPGGGCNEGLLAPAVATFRDAPGDGIRSDGLGTSYIHCLDGQVSIGRQEGRFRIDTKHYNPNLAKIAIALGSEDCLSVTCSGLPVNLTTDVTFQTHTRYACPTCPAEQGTILDLRTMAMAEVAYARLTLSFPQANKTSTLAFLNATEGIVSGMAPCVGGSPVRVECLEGDSDSCTRWMLNGDAACYHKYLKNGATFQGLLSVPVQLEVLLLP